MRLERDRANFSKLNDVSDRQLASTAIGFSMQRIDNVRDSAKLNKPMKKLSPLELVNQWYWRQTSGKLS
jgi:hypothetical protein